MKRPEVTHGMACTLAGKIYPEEPYTAVPQSVAEQVEIHTKYEGYIVRQGEQVEHSSRLETVEIPPTIDYHQVPSLSHEGREKLDNIRPGSLGQASRIPGLRPGDIQVLMIHIERLRRAG